MCVYALAFSVLAACSSSAQQAGDLQQSSKGTNVNPDAGMLADFKARVDDYVKLREIWRSTASPALKEKSQPADIATAEKSMAREDPPGACQRETGRHLHARHRGDVPADAEAAADEERGRRRKQDDIKDDAPAAQEVPFKVNAEYPKEVAMSTVPPDVLKALPPLPEDLQYRFVGKHLLLFCMRRPTSLSITC